MAAIFFEEAGAAIRLAVTRGQTRAAPRPAALPRKWRRVRWEGNIGGLPGNGGQAVHQSAYPRGGVSQRQARSASDRDYPPRWRLGLVTNLPASSITRILGSGWQDSQSIPSDSPNALAGA